MAHHALRLTTDAGEPLVEELVKATVRFNSGFAIQSGAKTFPSWT